MTMQTKIVAGDMLADPMAPLHAPPHDPLHMPKQVLTAEPISLRRRVAGLLSVLLPGRRRPG